MALGKIVQITIGGVNLEDSLPFYEKLGFKIVAQLDDPFPWVQLTDGLILITLNEDNMPYTGLTYFADDMADRVKALEEKGIVFEMKTVKEKEFFDAVLLDPEMNTIKLINYDISSIYQPEGQSNVVCGEFGELSILCEDVPKALEFYKKLGFHVLQENLSGAPWVSLHDGLMGIGLYSTEAINHYFSSPAITYNSPDMALRIQKMREMEIDFHEEKPNDEDIVNDVVVLAPEGQCFFFFKS